MEDEGYICLSLNLFVSPFHLICLYLYVYNVAPMAQQQTPDSHPLL